MMKREGREGKLRGGGVMGDTEAKAGWMVGAECKIGKNSTGNQLTLQKDLE